jgi:hypothetical protein
MYFVLGLLEVAYETRHHLLRVKAEEIRVPPEKRQKVKLIWDRVVAVALDHPDVVRGNMRLVGDLVSRETAMRASLGHELAESLIDVKTRPGIFVRRQVLDRIFRTSRVTQRTSKVRFKNKRRGRVARTAPERGFIRLFAHAISVAQRDWIIFGYSIDRVVSGETRKRLLNNGHPAHLLNPHNCN